MDLNKIGDKLQNKLYRDAYRKLSKILRGLEIPLDFTKTMAENEYEIDQAFKPVYAFILSFLETVALTSINYSRLQLGEINNKVSVKNTEIEITVNWSKVDESVLNFLQGNGDYTNGYFDIVTQAIATGNRNRLQDEYIAYVRGEKTLQDAYNFLRSGLSGPQRANLIVRSEITEVWAIAQQESYRTAGTISNEWNTRNDGPKVCPICQPLNGLEAVIGQTFPGTRLTRPGAHIGCRCWLSPVPMTDEQIEKFINEGSNEKVKVTDKRKKKEKVVAVETPSTYQTPNPSTLDEFKRAFEEIEREKYKRNERIVEQEIVAQKALNRTSKKNHAAIREYDKAVIDGAEQKEIDLLMAKKIHANDQHEKQIRVFSEIKKQKDSLDKWVIEEQRKTIYADKPANQTVNFTDNDVSTNVVNRGLAEFNKLIPESFFYGLSNSINVSSSQYDYITVNRLGLDRSWYKPSIDTVYFGRLNTTSTVIHEFVHWLEFKYTSINDKAVQFLDRRTVGESSVKLNTLYPGQGYADTEETKVDKFDHPYMGKSYNQNIGRTTEILTMGIEDIWINPKKFLDKDEDYFTFIMRDILGKIK